jgi:hypothetical protein
MDLHYTIEENENTLIFRTAHFKTDQGSVLHSGIYNREFSSMLASMAAAGLAYPLFAAILKGSIFFYAALLFVVTMSFPLFMRYVFKERFLTAVFDHRAGKVELFLDGLCRRRTDSIPLKNIRNIMIEKKTPVIENPDGVEFVKKISLQHHTAIPGFGDETPFFLLNLGLADDTVRTLYSDSTMKNVIDAYDAIREFLKI